MWHYGFLGNKGCLVSLHLLQEALLAVLLVNEDMAK